MVGRRKISFFNEVKLRVLSKLSSWQSKNFTRGGKEVLTKALKQAIPAYAMSIFKIRQGLCSEIEKAIARFWWGSLNTHRSIHWARWERLCHAKIRGGIGFREFSSFNQTLIAKQRWRILHNPDSLMAKILKAKYFKHINFMEAKLGSNPSFVWRSILWGKQVLHKGLRWRIVKSGYQQAIKLKFPDRACCSDSSKTQWKANGPPGHVEFAATSSEEEERGDRANNCCLLGNMVFKELLYCGGEEGRPHAAVARAEAIVASYRRIKSGNGQDLSRHQYDNKKTWEPPYQEGRAEKQGSSAILFVPRKCNVIAHNLANVALEFEVAVTWIGDFLVQVLMLFSSS
ncbi:hypothetical protein KPL70_007064 [Citrus sinensis]|nr:hypothetical protein KPL70_007064 [Citrus sinensis]